MGGMIKAISLSSIVWNGANDFNRIKRQRGLCMLCFFMEKEVSGDRTGRYPDNGGTVYLRAHPPKSWGACPPT